MSWLGALIALERSALARVGSRLGAVALALFGAEVGALGLLTALLRFRGAFAGPASGLLRAVGAVGLGLDLAIVLGSLAFGVAIVALTRPLSTDARVLSSARASAGTMSILFTCFIVTYALTLGSSRVASELIARRASHAVHAALLAFALTPSVLVALVLIASALVAIALVGRGVPPGRALASGLDHVLRDPAQALALLVVQVLITGSLLQLGALAPHGVGVHLLVFAPLCSLAALLAVSAFDAAIGGDPRIATG